MASRQRCDQLKQTQRALRDRRRAAGLHRLEIWLSDEAVGLLRHLQEMCDYASLNESLEALVIEQLTGLGDDGGDANARRSPNRDPLQN